MATLALDMFVDRVRKYIGAYAATLGRLDGIVFTAGIGENGPEIREDGVFGPGDPGIRIDPEANKVRGRGEDRLHARQPGEGAGCAHQRGADDSPGDQEGYFGVAPFARAARSRPPVPSGDPEDARSPAGCGNSINPTDAQALKKSYPTFDISMAIAGSKPEGEQADGSQRFSEVPASRDSRLFLVWVSRRFSRSFLFELPISATEARMRSRMPKVMRKSPPMPRLAKGATRPEDIQWTRRKVHQGTESHENKGGASVDPEGRVAVGHGVHGLKGKQGVSPEVPGDSRTTGCPLPEYWQGDLPNPYPLHGQVYDHLLGVGEPGEAGNPVQGARAIEAVAAGGVVYPQPAQPAHQPGHPAVAPLSNAGHGRGEGRFGEAAGRGEVAHAGEHGFRENRKVCGVELAVGVERGHVVITLLPGVTEHRSEGGAQPHVPAVGDDTRAPARAARTAVLSVEPSSTTRTSTGKPPTSFGMAPMTPEMVASSFSAGRAARILFMWRL
jgi:hypothetical protein